MKPRLALALAAGIGGLVIGVGGVLATPDSGSTNSTGGAVAAGTGSPSDQHSAAARLAPKQPTQPPAAATGTASAPSASHSAPAKVRTIRANITGYGYFDNTPAGSSLISNPVLHTSAGGTGSYSDPITVAVGHSLATGEDVLDWPAGTRFYLPNLRRYFLVEDTCGDGSTPQNGPCHTGYPAGTTTWLDLWIGGEGGTAAAASRCMDAITRVSTVVVSPAAGYPVVSGGIYGSAGCARQYGDAIPAR